MKYIITKKQYILINEISRSSGNLPYDAIESFFDHITNKLSRKEKIQYFIEFFSKKMGYDVKKRNFSARNIENYFSTNQYWNLGDEFKTKDALAGIAYYIAKKHFGLKQGVGISYIFDKRSSMYYFFDPLLKIFVGLIAVDYNDFSKNSVKVQISATDDELIGTGYGTKMYLTIINDVDYLFSDETLYSGSYRMWKHVLPKYVNVWGVIEKDYLISKFVKIDPDKKMSVRKFDYFVASSKHSRI